MKKENKSNKSKKNVLKWATYSLFLILFGTSAIFNIAYLPKYFTLKNYDEINKGQTLNINISAYNEQNGINKLFTYIYQTNQRTLGKLMTQDIETFYLTNNGTWLEAISYYNGQEKETIHSQNPYYWTVYYNDKIAEVGIADLYLHKGDNIDLRYQKYN